MLTIVWLPLLHQVVAPVGLLAWVSVARPAGRVSWVARVLLAALYIALIATAGLWLALPWYLPLAYTAGLPLAAFRSGRHLHPGPESRAGRRGAFVAAGTVLATVASLVTLVYAFEGWRAPVGAVELAFPLHNGTYLVANGGSTALLNPHLGTLKGERFRPWRGQSYGVDIVRLNALGLPGAGLLPRDPAAYAAFGDVVHAPCTGFIVTALDQSPDMPPPMADRNRMAGNHVILRCGRVWVVLAHLRRGSVAVHPGSPVEVGTPLGRVGNSGNTGQPHLHIHAQGPGTTGQPMSGEPLPIRFGGTYPVRNLRIRAVGPS